MTAVMANRAVAGLKAYDPGHDLLALRTRFQTAGLIELGSNENPFGASPRALAAARAALDEAHLYPDPAGRRLKRALASSLGLDPSQIALGNGSHELLMLIAQTFVNPTERVVFSEFGFAVFALATRAVDGHAIVVPALPRSAEQPRGHDYTALAAAAPGARLVYIANPNNPTGTWAGTQALDAFLNALPANTLVVLDEAYHEYADPTIVANGRDLLNRHGNLIVTRTFSKGHGLAGLRVGYALAAAPVIALLERLRESFNVNGVALAAAEAALGDPEFVSMSVADCAHERAWLSAELSALGIHVTPSQTNFLLVDFDQPAGPLEAQLLERGVVVRPMIGYGLPTCLRITIAQRAANQRLLDAIAALNR
jgi:histidinol-phosphate aminotransferase